MFLISAAPPATRPLCSRVLVAAWSGCEPEPELAETARRMLRELAIENATIVEGALAAHAEDGPYDVILLNGSIEEIPASVLGQLRRARLAAILASGANSARPGKAFLLVKIDGEASGLPHFDAGARALPGFSPARRLSPSRSSRHCCPDPTVA